MINLSIFNKKYLISFYNINKKVFLIMTVGGHFNRDMVEGFGFEAFKTASPRQQEEIINEMNIIHMNNDKEELVMSDENVFNLAKSIVIDGKTRVYPTKEQPEIQIGGKRIKALRKKKSVKKCHGGAEKENYITVSTKISKKLSEDFNVPYKPAIMQTMLSIYRKKSSNPVAVQQLKDAEKYIREHKDEFVKRYMEAVEATAKSGGKKIVLKKKTTKKTGKK